ncbi:transcriptional regulator, TetR family [Hyphomonas neptunium ATCC 15444]|uniref:Transcriptional regulator, TetR family n=1 Tax=Hyphomonas neptunium (strain ATCC 15444) TaxID=228405 RepID=Q0C1S9_HYPNA|nr:MULTISPECIES: TetR/AcrR family transcriptional regulator [Hyphomonas]ABI76183.1 transcriptional regulator, TetR family [Hyphomonas neptunium ATCC 15444]
MSGRRLPRDQRRTQLLEAAAGIVRAEGADALTLARVAERAGVTKPVAYEHFETRTGLLKALYRHFDAHRIEITAADLEQHADSLEAAVPILAAAYVDCAFESGPEFASIAAALAATGTKDAFGHELRESYTDLFYSALTPYRTFSAKDGKGMMLGLIGAADALAQEAVAGRISRKAAVAALTRIMLSVLVR